MVYTPVAIGSQATGAQAQCINETFAPITVTATGDGLSYQWFSNTSASNSGGITLGAGNGGQTNSYTPQATTVGALYYYCVVSGPCGSPQTSAVSGAFVTDPCFPTITSFSPSIGSVGTLVTITGSNLSSPTAFTIGGVSAIAVSNDGTTLVGMVMPGATTGPIGITTANGSVSSAANFTVTPTPYPSLQQGSKLVGTGNIGAANQGYSVSVSADGNTAILGGPNDNNSQGAAWIYTRSAGVWSQQGGKLVGTGNIGQIGRAHV